MIRFINLVKKDFLFLETIITSKIPLNHLTEYTYRRIYQLWNILVYSSVFVKKSACVS